MALMDRVFSVIARLRTAELSLLSQENTEKAARIRDSIEDVSAIRDRLIVLELAHAEESCKSKRDLHEANALLREYLSDTGRRMPGLKRPLKPFQPL